MSLRAERARRSYLSVNRGHVCLLTILGLLLYSLCLFVPFTETNPELAKPRRVDPGSGRSHDKNIRLLRRDFSWIRERSLMNATPLGNWLLSGDNSSPPAKRLNNSRPFLILVWKHGPFLERRHLRRFSPNGTLYSPWENCSVSNCRLTYQSRSLHRADAVIFHLHLTKGAKSLPRRENLDQRWIFLTDESPANTFLYRGQNNIADYDGLFNWSMTYRMNSDVPVPYGRTAVRLPTMTGRSPTTGRDHGGYATPASWGRKNLAAILASNCKGGRYRWQYVKELKYILGDDLQILGRCPEANRTACPGHYNVPCTALAGFKFYLAFENSNCREYLSEKVFWNAYEMGSVPVIMGAPRADCERLLPPDSYIHVGDFEGPGSLARYLLRVGRGRREYERLHGWRSRYRVINEHGYFGSHSGHYCRVCQALNYNSPAAKVYLKLHDFLNKERDCSLTPVPNESLNKRAVQ